MIGIGHMADVSAGRWRDPPGLDTFDHVLARWIDAEARGDAVALDALLDDEFRGDDPRGVVLTKREWLDRHRTGARAPGAFTWDATHVQVHDGVGVATGVQTQTTHHDGRDATERFQATLVAVQGAGRWSIVNLQLSATVEGSEQP